MKNRIGLVILVVLGIALGAMVVRAQSTPPSDGTTIGNYITNTDAEFGVRFLGTDGNLNTYRSDLDYGRGFRLFNFDFVARSKDGNGKLFDNFRVNALGWGGDPNEYLRIQADKNKIYRFDANYREFSYFNNLTNLALNEHLTDTRRKFGDFNLTLLPDNQHFKANFGYTMDRNNGNGIITYDYQRDEFPIQVAPYRSASNDYRAGFDASWLGIDISFLQGFRYYKDDTVYSIPSLNLGNNPTNTSVITFLNRELPTRGHEPFTRFSLHTLVAKKLDFTGRFIYTEGTTQYNMTEKDTGVDASNNNIVLDLFNAFGNAKRHNGVGDFGLTFFATDRLTISDTFRVNDFQISGGEPLTETLYETRTSAFGTITLPTTVVSSLMFRFIGYRLFTNTAEVDYKFDPRFIAHFGYRHTDRRTALGDTDQGQGLSPVNTPLSIDLETDHTNSYFGGFMARPVSIWTVYFDIDKGTADNVFTRISNYDYTNIRVRSSLKPTKTLSINASFISKSNDNPTENLAGQAFGTDITGRIFTSSVDWTPSSRFSITGGYTLNHITSDASIIFFLNNAQTNGTSLYFMRDNNFFFNSRIELHPRVTLFLGYRVDKDLGQGDRKATSPTQLLSSFPLTFQSPEVRLTFKIMEHVEWNAGWQYYDYKEKNVTTQNYRANLPYTSLRFTF